MLIKTSLAIPIFITSTQGYINFQINYLILLIKCFQTVLK